ncbi:MAG: carbohydrate porin [Limisphaerales bacterium]
MNARTIVTVAGGVCLAMGASAQTTNDPPKQISKESARQEVIAAEVKERETGSEGDHMTGDWGGLRTKLVDRGVHLQAGYIGEVIGNVSGGLRTGTIYQGLFEMGVRVDTEAAGLWKGGTFQISSLFPHGSGFSHRYVGDLLTASNIEGYESWRLYDLWYEHAFGEKFSVRVGQFAADEEFAYTEAGGNFLNSAFGWPAFISGNTLNTGPAFFAAAPGIRFNLDVSRELFVRLAAFDGDTFDNPQGDPRPNRSGTRFEVNYDQGFFGIAEMGYRWNQTEKGGGHPGGYKFGMWAHSGEFESNFHDENREPFIVSGREPRVHSKNFGVYAAVEQMLWREEADQGVYGFARAGANPEDRSFFELVVDGGVVWQGLIPTRDEDLLGLGAVYARLSKDIRRAEMLDAATNGTVYEKFSTHETVFEAFYTVQLAQWWTLQPDVQWIIHPGGSGSGTDAVVVALRTSIVF